MSNVLLELEIRFTADEKMVGLFVNNDAEPLVALPISGTLTKERKDQIAASFVSLAQACLGPDYSIETVLKKQPGVVS